MGKRVRLGLYILGLSVKRRWIEENSRCNGRVAQANPTQTIEPNMIPEK